MRATTSVQTPDGVRLHLLPLVLAFLLACLLLLLVAFPAEIFNSTYEHNEAEIKSILAWFGLRVHIVPQLALIGFVVVCAGLSVMLAGDEGQAGNPIAQTIGFVVAIPLLTLVYEGPIELFTRSRSRVLGTLRVVPAVLLVAIVCGLFSRLLQLQPPYLCGLFAGYATVQIRVLSRRQSGEAVLLGAGSLAVTAVLAWLAWSPAHSHAYYPGRSWGWVIADAMLFWTFVLGVEALVFALMPLRYLDGQRLREWHPVAWLVPQFGAAFFFIYVFMLLAASRPSEPELTAVLQALGFFAAFGLVSVAFWVYFQWERRPTEHYAADQPGA